MKQIEYKKERAVQDSCITFVEPPLLPASPSELAGATLTLSNIRTHSDYAKLMSYVHCTERSPMLRHQLFCILPYHRAIGANRHSSYIVAQ